MPRKSSGSSSGAHAHKTTSMWMKPAPAADYLSISLGTLRNWTSARYVPFARRGRVVRYHREQLDAWLSLKSCPGRTTLANAR